MKPHYSTNEDTPIAGIPSASVNLHVTTEGNGPQVILLHGLGLHSSVWKETAKALAEQRRVTMIDLPGHGHSSPLLPLDDLERIADALAESVPGAATWIG